MGKRKERKWLVAEKLRDRIRSLGYSHWRITKAKAQRDASRLNKRVRRFKLKDVKYVVRRVGWRRKKYWS